MILAAAAAADMDGTPPPELILGWQIRQFHALPDPGGLRDQRAGLLPRVSAALNTYDAMRSFRASASWAEWKRARPDGWAIVARIVQMREAQGIR